MRGAPLRRAALGVLLISCAAVSSASDDDDARARRLRTLEQESIRLQREMDGLARREKSLLGDVVRLDAEIALEQARLEDAGSKLSSIEDRLASREQAYAALAEEQARRAPAAALRVREIYKRGPVALLPRVLLPDGPAGSLDGLRYAAYLTRRDARQLAVWNDAAGKLARERAALSAERAELASRREEASRSAETLGERRAARSALLSTIRNDRAQHAQALDELSAAAAQLAALVGGLDDQPGVAGLDVRKFRGLLDWPGDGPVTAGFGKMIHPRFKTELPHPGLDIDAKEGSPFRAVFEGRVAYAAALHGYGLTVVVDHGNGVASVYAHAGVLLVQSGEAVTRGQELGRVGDSGSLRGSYLYFELRVAGKPEDPAAWLRRR